MIALPDLKSEIKDWSLSSDIKLLEYLQTFSSSINEKTKLIADKVDALKYEVVESEICLRNTLNEFLMLGISQFIENRVYDDDGEREDKVEETPNGITVPDPIVDLKEAFKYGQGAFNFFYFEEDIQDNNTQRFEDIYNTRPLPFIFGTPNFISSPNAGLESSVEQDDENFESNAPIAEANDRRSMERRSVERSAMERRSNDGLVGDKTFPTSLESPSNEYNPPPEIFDESYVKYVKMKKMLPEGAVRQKMQVDGFTQMEIDHLFGSETVPTPSSKPSEEEESAANPPYSKPKSLQDILSSQLQQKESSHPPPPLKPHTGDFDADEDEDEDKDLFSTNDDPYSLFAAPTRKSMRSSIGKKPIDLLFDILGDSIDSPSDGGSRYSTSRDQRSDSISSLFGSGESAMSGPSKSELRKSKSSFGDIFGENNDDSLFDEVKPVKPIQTIHSDESTTASKTGPSQLPSSSAEKLAATIPEPEEATKRKSNSKNLMKSMGASDLFGGGGLFDDESGGADKGLFATASGSSSNSTGPQSSTRKPEKSSRFASLFGDDGGGDDVGSSIFSEPSVPIGKNAAKKPNEVPAKKPLSTLFDETDDDGGLFGTKKTSSVGISTANKRRSFLDDFEDELPVKNLTAPTSLTGSNVKEVAPKSKQIGLFDDESESIRPIDPSNGNNPRAAKVSEPSNLPVSSKSDNPIEASNKKASPDDVKDLTNAPSSSSIVKQNEEGTKKKPLLGLFDEDETDETVAGSKPFKPMDSQKTNQPNAASLASEAMKNVMLKKKSETVETAEAVSTIPPNAPLAIGQPVVEPSPSLVKPTESSMGSGSKKKFSLFDDEEEEEGVGGSSSRGQEASVKPNPVSKPIENTVKPKKASIFDEDDDDDDTILFKKPIKKPAADPLLFDKPLLDPPLPSLTTHNEEKQVTIDVPKATLTTESPSVPTGKKTIGSGLASRIAGLDPSKMVLMPGQGIPMKFTKDDSSSSNKIDEKSAIAVTKSDSLSAGFTDSVEESDLSAAALSKVTLTSSAKVKPRRAPTKKSFQTADEDPESSKLPATAALDVTPQSNKVFEVQEEMRVETKTAVVSTDIGSGLFTEDRALSKPNDASEPVIEKPLVKAEPAPLPSGTSTIKTSSSLFGDEEIVPTSVGKTQLASKTSKFSSLFGDDDAFAPTPTIATKSQPTKAKAVSSLFQDDEDGGLFASPSMKSSQSNVLKANIFKDGDPSLEKKSSLFGEETVPKKQSIKPVGSAKKGGLFGDEDDDSLFGSSKPSTKPSSTRSKGLFDD